MKNFKTVEKILQETAPESILLMSAFPNTCNLLWVKHSDHEIHRAWRIGCDGMNVGNAFVMVFQDFGTKKMVISIPEDGIKFEIGAGKKDCIAFFAQRIEEEYYFAFFCDNNKEFNALTLCGTKNDETAKLILSMFEKLSSSDAVGNELRQLLGFGGKQ